MTGTPVNDWRHGLLTSGVTEIWKPDNHGPYRRVFGFFLSCARKKKKMELSQGSSSLFIIFAWKHRICGLFSPIKKYEKCRKCVFSLGNIKIKRKLFLKTVYNGSKYQAFCRDSSGGVCEKVFYRKQASIQAAASNKSQNISNTHPPKKKREEKGKEKQQNPSNALLKVFVFIVVCLVPPPAGVYESRLIT